MCFPKLIHHQIIFHSSDTPYLQLGPGLGRTDHLWRQLALFPSSRSDFESAVLEARTVSRADQTVSPQSVSSMYEIGGGCEARLRRYCWL